jgi:hypothetical protein
LTASSASMPVSSLLPGHAKDVQGLLGKKAPQQQAAYAAFVSTAKPIAWSKAKGWAQPVARVGAGAYCLQLPCHMGPQLGFAASV